MVLVLFLLTILLATPKTLSEGLPRCPPGLTGEKCSQQCPQGKFGDECRFECSCQNGAYCSPIDGECDCRHIAGSKPGDVGPLLMGWEGLLCDRPCRKGFFSHNCGIECPCTAGQGECKPQTGECQCLAGFMGKECALTCNHKFYGLNCTQRCTCGMRSDGCNHITGQCICHPGWHGWICDSKCPDGLWGTECSQNCSCGPGSLPCKQTNGTVCHCPPGWRTDRNGQCTARCPKGTYGYGCEDSCLVRRENIGEGTYTAVGETCKPETGSLICSPGYEGVNCWNSCPPGKYGEECKGTCKCVNGDCNHETGDCRCFKGWKGLTCSERCSHGTYGYNCTLKCIPCHNGGYCSEKEECVCQQGWKGIHCSQKTYDLVEDIERSSMKITLTLAALLLTVILVLLLFFARMTQSEQGDEYQVTQVLGNEVTILESQEDHVFDGSYRNMVRLH